MSIMESTTSNLAIHGTGFCAGGHHPDPPLDAYPLLCWTGRHPRFGDMVVHLEDQSASVHDVATSIVEYPSYESIASRFGTTVPHVAQAIQYATACGFLVA